jgi:hypothetical protein
MRNEGPRQPLASTRTPLRTAGTPSRSAFGGTTLIGDPLDGEAPYPRRFVSDFPTVIGYREPAEP